MEGLQRIGLFTHTHELDGLAGDVSYRQRSTTPGVTVRLGEHNAGQGQSVIEGLGCVGGVLPSHGIDHEQGFRGTDSLMQAANLIHHLFINVEAAGGIQYHHIQVLATSRINGTFRNGDRVLIRGTGEELNPHLTGKGFQLPDSGRPVDVGTHH